MSDDFYLEHDSLNQNQLYELSLEDPSSIASDSTLLKRNSPIRQSLQRKTSEQIQTVLMRGGIRGSLQTAKRTEENQANRNSFQG